jgi:hypothetical protein
VSSKDLSGMMKELDEAIDDNLSNTPMVWTACFNLLKKNISKWKWERCKLYLFCPFSTNIVAFQINLFLNEVFTFNASATDRDRG